MRRGFLQEVFFTLREKPVDKKNSSPGCAFRLRRLAWVNNNVTNGVRNLIWRVGKPKTASSLKRFLTLPFLYREAVIHGR